MLVKVQCEACGNEDLKFREGFEGFYCGECDEICEVSIENVEKDRKNKSKEIILEKLNEKLKEVEKIKPANSEMERYQEGLCTAYIEAMTIVKSNLEEYRLKVDEILEEIQMKPTEKSKENGRRLIKFFDEIERKY